MSKEQICAGIVTYEPEIGRLKENIDAVISQVSRVFVVDNGSGNIRDIENITSCYEKVEIMKNIRNEGIAKALNQIILAAKKQGYKWALTLDQDSVCSEDLIAQYVKYADESMGMLTCDVIDRNYVLKEKPVSTVPEDVKKCITSGCLTNVDAVIQAGGFDEKLFMDMVDYDMCYSLREHGYRIVKVPVIGLLHEVGKSRKYNILGFEFAVNNHSAERKYTISRNSVYLVKKHHMNPVAEYAVIFRRIFTVLFFEEKKPDKVRAIIRGVLDGWKMQKSL